MKTKITILGFSLFFLIAGVSGQKSSLAYTVKMENPEWHFLQVELACTGIKKPYIDFKMPVWTPGYYQRLDFGKNVKNFRATDADGNELKWEKINDNTWRVTTANLPAIRLHYDIKTERAFVATPYVDENRAYIIPAGVFFHIDKMISHPVQVALVPYYKWTRVATGLDSVAGKKFTYTAPDFDILYDSPLLAGDLEELPSFKVRGITHRFIGYKPGNFDRVKFMEDLKKIVEASVNLIGHIPYKHYTFIAIGPGQGGIEHLNNTTFSFNGNNFDKRDNYIRTLHFLAHEYFHHYNVKRIRPIELGPFDYDKGSRTKMLWVSEGLSVYYEYIVVRRAGISTDEELWNALRGNMKNFENKPGRLYQTLEQASYETWSDGPFGRTGDEINKTISYYDKGPAVGLLFDFKIRHLTENKKSLDDVMRLLYKEYYQKKKRGFTEAELHNAFMTVAGDSLNSEYDYVTTTAELDYPAYFEMAGLKIDTNAYELPGAYTGFSVRERNDSVFIANVDYESPAWNAGIRRGQYIYAVNGVKPVGKTINDMLSGLFPGNKIMLRVSIDNIQQETTIIAGKKKEKSFLITPDENPTPQQKQLLDSWLKG
jgi:predicted metalloprotease with PDZ domain